MADLKAFRQKVKEYRDRTPRDREKRSQKQLAADMNIDEGELSRRLNGRIIFSPAEIQRLILVLAEWQTITTRQQVEELLVMMDCSNFSSTEWKTEPLISLQNTPIPLTQLIKPNTNADALTSKVPHYNVQGGMSIGGGKIDKVEFIDNRINQINQPVVKERYCPAPDAPPLHFGGRSSELNQLKEQLKANEVVALTAVQGLGGIGKTTLARKLAYDLYYEDDADCCFRAVLWASITRVFDKHSLLISWLKKVEPDFVPLPDIDLATLTQLTKTQLETTIEQKCKHCGSDRVLLVLDDVWENGLDVVRMLMEVRPPRATVLVTTRSQKVVAKLNAVKQELKRLSPTEGAKLLQTYLPQEDVTTLALLSQALGGHSLALTLAASRRNAYPERTTLTRHIAEYEEQLPEGTQFTQLELDDGQTKEENLTLALSLSYNELKEDYQIRFQSLGVLAYDQPFDLPLLAALWGIEKNGKDDFDKVEQYTRRLWQLALLESLDETEYGQGWYRLHPLLHTYALALLKTNNTQYDLTLMAYQNYIIQLAHRFCEMPPEEWKQLDPYLPQINRTGEWLEVNYTQKEKSPLLLDRTLQFTLNVCPYLSMRREVGKIEWFEMGLNTSRLLKKQENEAQFLNEIILYYLDRGNRQLASTYCNQALALLELLDDSDTKSSIVNNIGRVYFSLGEHLQSLEYYNRALEMCEKLGLLKEKAIVLNNIGLFYFFTQNNPKLALEYYLLALDICENIKDYFNKAITCNNIGRAYADLFDDKQARQYFESALSLYSQVGNKTGEAIVYNNIGYLWATFGEHKQALEYYHKALPIRQKVNDQAGEAATLTNLGSSYATLLDYRQALERYKQALPRYQEIGDANSEINVLTSIRTVYIAIGDIDSSNITLEALLIVYKRITDLVGEATTLNIIGSEYSKLGDTHKALNYFDRAIHIYKQIRDQASEALVRFNAATTYNKLGQRENALREMEKSVELRKASRSQNVEEAQQILAQWKLEITKS